MKKIFLTLTAFASLFFTQCDTTKQDIEAINARNVVISREKPGNYFVGRRYHIPATRFWGYVRKPGESWRNAQLVIMDESISTSPDRSEEYGPNQKYGKDNNCEYYLFGNFTGKKAYEPNTNQELPLFRIKGYQLVDANPGWLFKPSEKYSTKAISLRPVIMP